MRSPFKFLDAYEKEDADRFFGRERETAQLYNAVHASNLVLVYGGSGTGKTSLINCGLGNQFVESDSATVAVDFDIRLQEQQRSIGDGNGGLDERLTDRRAGQGQDRNRSVGELHGIPRRGLSASFAARCVTSR